MSIIRVEIVSSEKLLYSGEAEMVVAPGIAGELGILPRHTPLLTQIKPGTLKIIHAGGEEEFIYVSGGVLEVRPDKVTVLADIAERGEDLDEQRAEQSRKALEEKIALHADAGGLDYAKAQAELAQAVAQLQAIQKLRKRGH